MKKIFRMALVCALAGATLLYTGCTKDYSEDISELQKRLDNVEGTQIKTLQDQVAALQQAKTQLEAADAKAAQAISTLEANVATLQSQVKTLEAARTALEASVAKNAADIQTINGKIDEINGQIKKINDNITSLQGQIDSLAKRVKANEDAIKDINETLAKKADKTWVEEELAKKADKTWVEETLKNYATLKDLQALESKLQAQIDVINTTIQGIQTSISELKTAVQGLQDSKLDKSAFNEWLANDFKKVSDDLETAKNDIVKLKSDVIKAQNDATQALSETEALREALKLYAKTEWVKELANSMKQEFNTELAKKVNIADYVKDTAAIYKAIRDVDAAVKQVIIDYQAADEVLQNNINTLKSETEAALATKLDKVTFEQFCDELETRLSGIELKLDKVFNRIQSVVYVPEYNDSKITVNYAVLAASVPPIAYAEGEGEELEAEIEVEDAEPNYIIETTSIAKYRIYGENASGIVESLVKIVNDEVAANGESSTLTFDVVRVRTRINKENAEVLVVGAEVDDLNPDIISLTIAPRNLGDEFYMANEYFAPSVRAMEDEVPNYSMSLVVTNKEESKLITSEYENIVPAAQPDEISVAIIDGEGKNINYLTGWFFAPAAELVEIAYTDTDTHELLAGHTLTYTFQGKTYSYDEITALDVNIPEPVCNIVDNKENFTFAIDASKITVDDYIVVDADDSTVPGTATATLGEVNLGGVYTFDLVNFIYTVGQLTVPTGSLISVTPFKVALETEIWESADVEPFTWNYTKDAAGDALETPAYNRENAVVKYAASELEKLASCDLKPTDFSHMTPASYVIKAIKGTDTTDVTALCNIAPKFDKDVLLADVTNFEFKYDKYIAEAVYNYPNNWAPAVEVTVTTSFIIADRDREPIVITLPESVVDFQRNLGCVPVDKLADAEVVKTFAEHSLTDDDVIAAFKKTYAKTDSVTFVVEGKPVTGVDPDLEIGIVAGKDQDPVLTFYTSYKVNNSIVAGKLFEPSADYLKNIVLWYGQEVIVKKTINVNVDGIYDFERIPEYVAYKSADDCYTTLQPWWQPDGATVAPYTVPVTAYDAHKVLLNQHFRVIDYKKNAVCTNLEGEMKEAYSFLERVFKLEEPNGTQTDFIADPRNLPTVKVAQATGVKVADNIVEYYSKSAQEDIVGNLYVVNSNDSKVAMTTSFNGSKVAKEDYSNYVIKLYDPLQEITYPEDVQRLNINNSQVFVTSIYEFLSLKDNRGFEIIDAKQDNGWVVGNDKNGFATGATTDAVYSLTFTNEMTFVSQISEETKARISFDAATGKLTYKNSLQTQLADPIIIKLAINVEYPWGTRTANVTVEFYNDPV